MTSPVFVISEPAAPPAVTLLEEPHAYAIVLDDAEHDRALALARGSFQRDVIMGLEGRSCGTRRGKAARFSGKYRLRGLFDRLDAAKIAYCEVRTRSGRRVLVFGVRSAEIKGRPTIVIRRGERTVGRSTSLPYAIRLARREAKRIGEAVYVVLPKAVA